MKRVIAIPIIFFVSFLGAIYFLLPKFGELKNLKDEVAKSETRFAEKQKEFLNLQKISAELENYKESLTKINTALPQEISLADLLNFFQGKASSSGLIIKAINQTTSPQPIGKEEEKTKLQENYFSLSLVGSLASFEEFLKNVENSARLIEVETVSIEEAGEGLLEFNLLVKVYSYQ
jgi:Tfp pilus assembly protein PilO